jgi:hypothetical protein
MSTSFDFLGQTVVPGDVGNMLNRTMFTATLGTAAGWLDWTGGTRLDEIAPVDQLGWPFLTGISRHDGNVEAVPMSWGSVKALLY